MTSRESISFSRLIPCNSFNTCSDPANTACLLGDTHTYMHIHTHKHKYTLDACNSTLQDSRPGVEACGASASADPRSQCPVARSTLLLERLPAGQLSALDPRWEGDDRLRYGQKIRLMAHPVAQVCVEMCVCTSACACHVVCVHGINCLDKCSHRAVLSQVERVFYPACHNQL